MVGVFTTLFFVSESNTEKQNSSTKSLRLKTESDLIAPLLLSGDSGYLKRDDTYSRSVEKYISNAKESGKAIDISFYTRELHSGIWTGVNQNDPYAPASLTKVLVLIALYKKEEDEPSFFKKQLIYTLGDDLNKGEFYKPTKSIIPGKQYSVQDLIEYMIIYSDNNATNMLLSELREYEFTRIATDLEIPLPTGVSTGTEDFLSASEYSRLFRVLYNSTYLSEEHSKEALSLLTTIDFKEGIISQVPETVKVANKFGERTILDKKGELLYRELHDCGIIYAPQNPFLICIMTKGQDFDSLSQIIRDLTKMTYIDSQVNKKVK